MTSTITVSAHPVPPNTAVEVHAYDDKGMSQIYILENGAIHSFTISGVQAVHVHESNAIMVAPYEPAPVPEAAPSDQPTVDPTSALSTTG